jgi:hypothetical protein
MDINVLSLIVGILGSVITIASLAYAVYSTRKLSKGIKIGPLNSIRKLIDRMEAEKHKHPLDSSQWSAIDNAQDQMEGIHSNLRSMFNISDNEGKS